MINLPNLSSMERHLHKLELVLATVRPALFLTLKTSGQTGKFTRHNPRRRLRVLRNKEILQKYHT